MREGFFGDVQTDFRKPGGRSNRLRSRRAAPQLPRSRVGVACSLPNNARRANSNATAAVTPRARAAEAALIAEPQSRLVPQPQNARHEQQSRSDGRTLVVVCFLSKPTRDHRLRPHALHPSRGAIPSSRCVATIQWRSSAARIVVGGAAVLRGGPRHVARRLAALNLALGERAAARAPAPRLRVAGVFGCASPRRMILPPPDGNMSSARRSSSAPFALGARPTCRPTPLSSTKERHLAPRGRASRRRA